MKSINFIAQRTFWYSVSVSLVILAIASIATFGLRLGLDFTGGSLLELEFSDSKPDITALRDVLSEQGYTQARVQESGDNRVIIRLPELNEDDHQRVLASVSGEPLNASYQEMRFDSFGSSLGSELQKSALMAIVLVMLAIIIYIAYAFRSVSKPVASWKFGLAAIIALAHDVIIVVGVFAILGKFAHVEIDSYFITAVLTLLGFSVHDTIVTLDRVREHIITMRDSSFNDMVNTAINATLSRSINTSLTTLFALLAIYFFGGASVRDLSLALSIGIVVGTYSSIFIAAPLLTSFYRRSNPGNGS